MNQTAISSVECIINKYQDSLSFYEHPEIYFAHVYLQHNGLNFRDEFINYLEVEVSSSKDRDRSLNRSLRLDSIAMIARECFDFIYDDILSI